MSVLIIASVSTPVPSLITRWLPGSPSAKRMFSPVTTLRLPGWKNPSPMSVTVGPVGVGPGGVSPALTVTVLVLLVRVTPFSSVRVAVTAYFLPATSAAGQSNDRMSGPAAVNVSTTTGAPSAPSSLKTTVLASPSRWSMRPFRDTSPPVTTSPRRLPGLERTKSTFGRLPPSSYENEKSSSVSLKSSPL